MGNVIPPQYGVPLTADELNSSIPTSILYGVTPSNEFIPVQINSVGALSISGTISVGTVTIEGLDPVGSSTHPLAVVNFGPDGYALRTAIFDEGNQLKVNTDGSINVNTTIALSNVGLVNTSDIQINPATENTLSGIKTQTDKFTFTSSRLLVDGSQVTQPISGIVQENPSTNAIVTTVTVSTTSTILIGSNLLRKGLIFQSKDSPVYYILGTTPATTSTYSYYVLKLNSLELENFYGTVSAVVASSTATVQVTEKI